MSIKARGDKGLSGHVRKECKFFWTILLTCQSVKHTRKAWSSESDMYFLSFITSSNILFKIYWICPSTSTSGPPDLLILLIHMILYEDLQYSPCLDSLPKFSVQLLWISVGKWGTGCISNTYHKILIHVNQNNKIIFFFSRPVLANNVGKYY